MRFLNIKFGYLSEWSVALFITLIFISKIEKKKKKKTHTHLMVNRLSIMDMFNEEIKKKNLIFKVKAIPEHHI